MKSIFPKQTHTKKYIYIYKDVVHSNVKKDFMRSNIFFYISVGISLLMSSCQEQMLVVKLCV